MNPYIEFRSKSGLSLTKLAQILGVSKSTLHYAEKEGRSLPTSALLKMSELEKGLNDPMLQISVASDWFQHEEHDLAKMISDQQTEQIYLQYRLGRKRRKLEHMRKAFQKCLRSLKTNAIAYNLCADSAGPKFQAPFNNNMLSIYNSFKANSPVRQLSLKLEIDSLKSELAVTEKSIKYLASKEMKRNIDSNLSEQVVKQIE